jgi:hypothetical protein
MTGKVSMQVNSVDISFDHFVRSFIDYTVSGMLGSLDNTEPIQDLKLTLAGDKIYIMLNGKAVSTNQFVNKIMKSTLFGMVAPLKGVSVKRVDELDNLKIEITH